MNQLTQAALVNNRILSILAAATQPMSAVDLYDKPEVRELVVDRNKVSMVLSDMWRAGRLTRVPCVVPGSSTKYAYEAKSDAKPARVSPTPKVKVEPQAVQGTAKTKPHITVTEHRVTIELDTIRITVEV
jgi:hypothetical protein